MPKRKALTSPQTSVGNEVESRREQLPSCVFCNLLLLVTSSSESSVLHCDSRLVADRRKKSFIHRTKDLKNLKQVATGYHVFRNAPRFPSALSHTTALSQASAAPTRYTVRYTVKDLVAQVKPTARLCQQGTGCKQLGKGV